MKQNVSKQKLALAGVMTAAALMSALPMSTFAAQYGTPGYLVAAAATAASATVPTSSTTFTFTDSGVVAQGESGGYKIEGTSLTINAAGTYTITGSCAKGSIKVKKGTTGVTLVLRDLTLTSATTAPLSVNKGSEVTVYVAGTVTLNDNEDPANETSSDEAVADAFEGAAIKVKSEGAKLTIEGTGTLNLNGNAKNGIKGAATASVTIAGATVNVAAAQNGVAADGSVAVTGGTLTIKAGNDGIKAEPDEDDADSLGTVTITGGEVTIDAGDDGIHAAGDLVIDGGEITIVNSCEGLEGTRIFLNGGAASIEASDDGVNAATDLVTDEIAIYINGGTWYINAGGDGLDAGGDSRNNSGGNIYVNGGTTVVFGAANSGNSALDFDGKCTHTGGTLLAVGMSGMAQAPSGGTYVVFGSAGMGSGQMGGMMGGNMGGFGGMIQRGSMGGMNQTAGGVSITSGATLSIQDSSGKELISTTAVKNANSIVFASDALTSGETYTLYVNGSAVATAAVGGTSTTIGGQQGQTTQPTAPTQGQNQGQRTQPTAPIQGQAPDGISGATTQPTLPNQQFGGRQFGGQQMSPMDGMSQRFGGRGGMMGGHMGGGFGGDMGGCMNGQSAAPQQPAEEGFGDMMLDAARANRDLGIGGMIGPRNGGRMGGMDRQGPMDGSNMDGINNGPVGGGFPL